MERYNKKFWLRISSFKIRHAKKKKFIKWLNNRYTKIIQNKLINQT